MKGWIFFLSVILNTISAGYSQAPESSLLWKISGHDLKSPSYIFGTFHIMCRSDFHISDTLKKAIQSSEQFYGEIPTDDLASQMKLAQKMMMTDRKLSDMMSDAEFKQASINFQQITGMPLQMLNNFKPFMALSLLTLNTISCSDKVQPESEFTALAKERQLPVLGLETIEDQINTINAQPIDSQMTDLKRTILNFDSVKHTMDEMIVVYKKRNIDSIYAFMKMDQDNSGMEERMILSRNRKWIPVIEKAISEKPVFFAVGAGHLGGGGGVISLLREKGYILTPVAY